MPEGIAAAQINLHLIELNTESIAAAQINLHLIELNTESIEFVCLQYIRRRSGRGIIADLQ